MIHARHVPLQIPARRLILLLVAAPLITPGLIVPAVGAAPATPSPAACTVAPRSVAEVVAAVNAPRATPAAGSPAAGPTATPPPIAASPATGPAASPTPAREPTGPGRPIAITLPAGDPAPPEVVAAMTATVEQFVACANAGDSLRQMALVTDDYLRRGFGDAPLTDADVAAFVGTPAAIALADQRAIVALRGARLLPGGYAAALVDLAAVAGPVPGEIRTDFVVFRQDPDYYRVAAYAAGLPPDQFGPEATPTS